MGSVLTADGVVESSLEQHPGIQALPNSNDELW
jgi:hypothetical protein